MTYVFFFTTEHAPKKPKKRDKCLNGTVAALSAFEALEKFCSTKGLLYLCNRFLFNT